MAKNLEIMGMMADENMDIRMVLDLVNVKYTKGGGHVTMGVDIDTAQQLMKSLVLDKGVFMPVLFVVNMQQYKEVKEIIDSQKNQQTDTEAETV
jgi:hypothetical protein